jgi:hypothetical protein
MYENGLDVVVFSLQSCNYYVCGRPICLIKIGQSEKLMYILFIFNNFKNIVLKSKRLILVGRSLIPIDYSELLTALDPCLICAQYSLHFFLYKY